VDGTRIDARLDALERWGEVAVLDPDTVRGRFASGALSPPTIRSLLASSRLPFAHPV